MLMFLFASPARQRWFLALLLLAGLLLGLGMTNTDLLRVYGSRVALIERQKAHDYVLVGTFGKPEWPAVVVEQNRGQGAVSFISADGQRHQYQGFRGAMKALQFRSGWQGGKTFTLVFHHAVPSPEGSPAFKGIR